MDASGSHNPHSSVLPSTTPTPEVHDATSVQCVYYTPEGPVIQDEPLLYRGVEPQRPRGFIRAETAPVEYTYLPAAPPPPPVASRWTKTKRRQADARVRRALRDAWCDPARARKDCFAAGAVYADLQDGQGMAMAFIAHAQTRLGDANLSELAPHLGTTAAGLAREEYSHAHAIYTSLLHSRPTRYDVSRHMPFERAARGQRMRPWPLVMGAEDAKAASIGA